MKRILLTAAALSLVAGSAVAAGDPAKGEKVFRKCKACHSIVAPDGNVIVKGGKTGPNLWGIVGSKAADVKGFKFSRSMEELGKTGFVWTEDAIAQYVKDPTAFLREKLGDPAARSKMTFKLRKGGEDVAAYLASLNPPAK